MKHLNLLKSHDWLAGLLLTLLLLMPSVRSMAQSSFTTTNLEAQGWTQVTDATALNAAADAGQLFVLVDAADQTKAMSRLNNTAPIYKTLADPHANPHEVWLVTRQGATFQLRNMNNKSEYLGNTAAAPETMYFTETATGNDVLYSFTLDNGKWLMKNLLCNDYVGSSSADANVIAANVASPFGFLIYTISSYDLLRAATASNPIEATVFVQNPSFETGDCMGWDLAYATPPNEGDIGARSTTDAVYQMTNSEGNYLFNTWVHWNTNYLRQAIKDLPEGEYEVSAVISSWEPKKLALRINGTETEVAGAGAGTGTRITKTIEVGTNHTLNFALRGALLDWWSEGVGGDDPNREWDFFKVDDVQLVCKAYFFTNAAIALPTDNRQLKAGQWYYYDVTKPGSYTLSGNVSDFVYTVDAAQTPNNVTTTSAQTTLPLPRGRVYFKTKQSVTTDDKTLTIALDQSTEGNLYTVCSLNVDGLPNKILGITLNDDGAGERGTSQIASYLKRMGPDLIATSENFDYGSYLWGEEENYPDNLKGAGYQQGTYRGGMLNNLAGLSLSGGLHFDTDGLNMYAKNAGSMTNEDIVSWEYCDGSLFDGNPGQFDELIGKGFRHYIVEIVPGFTVDAFCTHMDAGSREATGPNGEAASSSYGEDAKAREAQLRQMATYILTKCNNGRPKIFMGDTNCRYTREDFYTNFFKLLEDEYEYSDAWVEWCRAGQFPAYLSTTVAGDDYNSADKEIVDKIIYLNPKAPNADKLELVDFFIDAEGYVFSDGFIDDFGKDRSGAVMGDHPPVFATFRTSSTTFQSSVNSSWFEGETFTDNNAFDNNGGSLLYKGSSVSGPDSELYYLLNVGASVTGQNCWIDRKGQIVPTPEAAFPYGFIRTTETGKYRIRDSRGYYLYMNDPVGGGTGWYYGITFNEENNNNTAPTAFTLEDKSGRDNVTDKDNISYPLTYQGEAYTFSNTWDAGTTQKRYFNIEKTNLTISAAQTNGPWNDWYLISVPQMDEWNRFNTAYNNAKNILNVPLPAEQYTELTNALTACISATYSTCKGSNGLSQRLENAYAAALTYLKGYAIDGATANADGEGTWHHDFIPYDMNDSYNGLLASDGTSIADTKGIANPSFDNSSTGWENLTNVNGVVGNKLKLWIGDGNGYDSSSENYPNFAPTSGFSFDQTIANVPSGYYILSAHVSTAHNAGDNLVDYQMHVISLSVNGEKGYTGMQISNDSGDDVIEAVVYHEGGNFTLGAYSDNWFEIDDFKLTRYENYYNAKVTDAQFSTVCLPIQAKVPDGLRAYRLVSYTKNDNSNYVTLESVDDVIPAYTPVVIRAVPGVEVVIGIETVNNEPIAYVYFDEGGVRTPVPVTEMEEYKNDHPAAVLVTEEVPQIVDGYKMFDFVWSNATATAVENNEFHGVADAALLPGDSRYVNDQTNFTYYVLSKQEVSGEQKTGMFKLRTDAGVPRFRAFVKINGSDELSVKDFFLFSFGENGSETDGVETLPTERPALLMKEGIYNINGVKMNELQRGLNIVRMSDGTVKKIILR